MFIYQDYIFSEFDLLFIIVNEICAYTKNLHQLLKLINLKHAFHGKYYL